MSIAGRALTDDGAGLSPPDEGRRPRQATESGAKRELAGGRFIDTIPRGMSSAELDDLLGGPEPAPEPPAPWKGLLPEHRELLIDRGITTQVAAARGYESVNLPGALRELGFSVAASELTPGLLIPVRNVHGKLAFHQYRPDKPRTRDGKPVKYELPFRARMVLDVPVQIRERLADPSSPLWVTESPLKADAAVCAGLTCIATFGVWGWRGSNSKGGKTALSCWEWIALEGRTVYLTPDSDVATNRQVMTAVSRLGRMLDGRGADVRYLYIPPRPDGGKVGLDDCLASGGTPQVLVDCFADDEPPDTKPTPNDGGTHQLSGTSATAQPPPVEAPALAESPSILREFAVAVAECGLVGEVATAQLVYLVLTSRLLDKPVSLGVKGSSSSGKSYTVQTVGKFFPAAAVLEMTVMSEKALVHSDQDYAHRMIIMFEAVALREDARTDSGDNLTAYLVRSLLSEGRIVYPVTVKDGGGRFRVETIIKEGPTGLIFTTTKARIHNKNETRVLSVTSDDSTEQTRRVLDRLAADDGTQPDLTEWLQLQAWLQQQPRRPVVIPYAPALARLVPPVGVRLRRDFGAVLSLIRAHAVLHQRSRATDPQARIVADLDDYEVVADLVRDIVSDAVGRSVSETTRETVELVGELYADDDDKKGVTAADVAGRLKLDKSTASRRLSVAAADGYVLNLEERPGRPGRWVPGDPLPDQRPVLPAVAELSRAVARPAATGATTEPKQNQGTKHGGCAVASVRGRSATPAEEETSSVDVDEWLGQTGDPACVPSRRVLCWDCMWIPTSTIFSA